MKRALKTLVSAFIVLALAACAKSANDVAVDMKVQEYIGANIFEYPRFTGSGDIVDELNTKVDNELSHFLNWYNGSDKEREDSWYEVKSYPIKSKDYVQVVATAIEYPNYGTQGSVMSVNYDVKNNKIITSEDALAMRNLTSDNVVDRLLKWSEDEDGQNYFLGAGISSFAFIDGQLYIFADALFGSSPPQTTGSSGADENMGDGQEDSQLAGIILIYNVDADTVEKYDGSLLLSKEQCDGFDPPLSYMKDRKDRVESGSSDPDISKAVG